MRHLAHLERHSPRDLPLIPESAAPTNPVVPRQQAQRITPIHLCLSPPPNPRPAPTPAGVAVLRAPPPRSKYRDAYLYDQRVLGWGGWGEVWELQREIDVLRGLQCTGIRGIRCVHACAPMHACMYARASTCGRAHDACLHAYARACMCACMHAHVHAHESTHVWVH